MKKFVEYDGGEFKIPGYRNSVKDLIDDFAELSFSFSKGDLKEYQRSLGTFIDSLNISKKYSPRIFKLTPYLSLALRDFLATGSIV